MLLRTGLVDWVDFLQRDLVVLLDMPRCEFSVRFLSHQRCSRDSGLKLHASTCDQKVNG